MTCGYCWKRKKRKELGIVEVSNGERVPICKSCCRKIFKCTLKEIERRSKESVSDEYRVKIDEVRENGAIVYNIDSILESPPAKRHLQFLRKEWIKRQTQLKKQKEEKQ